MTAAEFAAYEARRNRVATNSDGVDDESALHRAILDECGRRGWIVFHGSMAHRTYRTPGEPDFVILADGGATILVECKSKRGKLSVEQSAVIAWAKKLDHTIHVVRSFAEFNALTKPNQP